MTTPTAEWAQEVVGVLRDARTLLDEDGWTQFALVDSEGCRCALGAIRVAATGQYTGVSLICSPGYGLAHRVESALAFYINDHIEKAVTLTSWNDESGRTQSQVLEAFDRAIAYYSVQKD